MGFTGEAVRQGNSYRFGVDSVGSIPRAFVSFNGEPYVVTRDGLIHITDLENGSGVLIQNNTGYDLADADPTSAFVYNSRMYFLDRNGDVLVVFDDPLTGDVGIIDFYTSIQSPSAAATDGTTVWVYDSIFDTLYTINPDTAATTSLGTVGFDVTTPSNNIGGMFYYEGKLYLLDNGTELMFVIDDPSASTLEATAVDVSVTEFGVSQVGVNGGSVHDGEAYMAGGSPDALYRFYNVRWDETIAAVEVDAGGNGSLDLSTVSKDATSFMFVPGYTAPSWLTISGMELVITNAPGVTEDTDFSPEVRALRGTKYENETLTVRVSAAGSTITAPGPPRSLVFTESHNFIAVTWVAASDNGGENPIRYDVRIDGGAWIDTGLNLFYVFHSLLPETEYLIEVVQVNSAGRGTIASERVTTDAAPVVITSPGAPRSLSLTETYNSIVATWTAADDNGGESPTHYDIRIDGGAWIDTGLDLTHTFSNLSAETEYTIEVVEVNSAGRGDIASESVTTDAVPVVITVPSAPRNLTADAGEDYVDLDWNAPADTGGAVVEAYKYRQRKGSGTWGPWTAIGSTATQYRVTGLTPDTTYSFEVRGVNSAGDGTPSQTVNVRTDALPLILTPPSAPQNLRVTGTDPTSIDLDWNAPADTGGAVIEAYKYRQRKRSGSWRPWTAIGSTATRYTVTGLDPDAQYTFQVRAVNSEGDGTPSQTVTARTDMALPLGTPQNIEVELTSTTALLKWAAATAGGAVEEYEVSYAEGASPGTTWIPTGSTGTRFFVKGLKRGTQYTFRVRGRNSEGAGAASRAVTQKTPIASLHNALFFKECVNYFDNGGRVSEHGNPSNIIRAVADNDYKTFTREKDLVLNIAVGGNPTRVDAIFVKGQDIERHSAEPTGGTGSGYSNRRMPSTVKNWEGTDVSTIVNGFQHDLYLLDQHFTATSVRLTFTGTDVKITEIMLLEFGLEIDSNADFTEIATNFVDRTGVVHPDPSGGISYTPPLGGGRDRWQIDYAVKVVPGKTILETPEDFLYWRAKNRNHVFCMEPSRFPWRIFPAVFLGKSVPVRYRTDDKTGGEILNFRVAEQ